MITKPLYIYPFPLEPDVLELVKSAKAALELDFLVLPMAAHPGCNGRVLAIGTPPPFLKDHALIRDPRNAEAMMAGLEWAVTSIEDTRATLVGDMLGQIFGAEVKELSREQVAFENISKNIKLDAPNRVPIFQ